ncbi:ATPase, T2SS/T4P/T4SS family (plasmid) [Marinobacter nanhaiticus D15-8W]|uniref:CpaF family protein n=1 Tax=Marinobacter nanhaiticus D15-8W TaxID=626887 RepID=N6WA66_9GAMM|nr:ATPase, T2SS/T4P/T4SS family [Marinobacter nanhaiticus]ENO17129.1 CpaF family protein [Marinobacter nanhaiticus D15-8W]BES73857.1 ATPase, T2SS/T4P/T4SS family [Marinobacter nanhaiticus D15-8W]
MSFKETLIGNVPENEADGWDLLLHYFEPLAQYYADPEVTEILVNRFDHILVERNNKMEVCETTFGDENALQKLMIQIANRLHQRLDDDHPILDARFPDGSRACCTLPSVSPYGATMTLRIAPRRLLTFDDLVEKGSLTQEMVDFLREKVAGAANMLVSGNTGSGKTTVLRAAAAFVDKGERVITAEDTQELHLGKMLPNCLPMEAPKRKTDFPVTLATLIKTMLRQRPDRGWVGEIRDGEAADAFLQLLNTGHTGCASSLHANSCEDAIARIQYLIATRGGISYELAGRQVLGSVQLLVHASRNYQFGRKITEICMVEDGVVKPVFRFNDATGQHERVG